ncbi:hypothetical protein GCM10023189_36050 [Nibrella saemangeumensis]|uniref:Glycosyltransferase RgtA/B/C/D-like domain-containing protein n=2 Tax=Nibrella saemangeumensis TaxID=1084526 RepID=A0ABP8N3F5_9BACT
MGWLLMALPVVAFAGLWSRYVVNVPKWDDHALRAFLIKLAEEDTLTGKTYQFFKQHNEHRIVYDRVISWLDYQLWGELNFTHLMAVGNLSLLGLLLVFALVLRRELPDRRGNTLWYAAPVAFILLNLSHWENMFWGMAALQNMTIMAWVVGCLYLLAYTPHRLAAFGLAVAATLTSGNGLLIWPVGLLVLAVQAVEHRKNRPALAGWLAGAALCIGLYFYGYEKSVSNPPTRFDPVQLLKGWLAFTGAAAEAFPMGPPYVMSILLGGLLTLLVVGLVAAALRRGLIRRSLLPLDYFFGGGAAFLLGTGAIVAWSRVAFGAELLITSRYKIYSLTLLGLLYVYLAGRLRGRWRPTVGIAGLVVGVVLAWAAYLSYLDETIFWRRHFLASQFNWSYETNTPPAARPAGIYQPAFYEQCLDQILQPATASVVPIDSVFRTGNSYVVQNRTLPASRNPHDEQYIRLRSAQRTYLMAASPVQNPTWRVLSGLAPAFLPGFQAVFSDTEPMPGLYQLDVVTSHSDGTCQVYATGRTLEITPPTTKPIETNW